MTSDPIRTGDGSPTLRHPAYGETYHDPRGARSEAEAKFLRPSRLAERLAAGPVRLLDVGFGLGINCAAALSLPAPHGLHVDTVEHEPEALDRGVALFPDDPMRRALRERGRYAAGTVTVRLHPGDLRRVLPELPGPYDVVFHDPFSPLKNTECWTVEVFALLRERLAADGVLTTYSESKVVRAGLAAAGFRVAATPPSPPHRGGTAAARTQSFPAGFDPVAAEDVPPWRDPDLARSGREIRAAREAAVRARAG